MQQGKLRTAAAEDGCCGDAGDDLSGGHVPGYHRICTDGGVVTDGDASEDGDAATDPDLVSKDDGFGGVPGVADGGIGEALVVSVADAGVFADHGAAADGDAGHGDEVDAAGEDDAFAQGDGCGFLGFEVEAWIEEGAGSELDVAGAIDECGSEDDDRAREVGGELGGEIGVEVKAAGGFTQLEGRLQQEPKRSGEKMLDGGLWHGFADYQGVGGETLPPRVSFQA
jgi:hypothetical protein